MTNEELAKELAKHWYNEEYGGQSWWTADEIVEDFLLWLLGKPKIIENK